MEAITKDMAIHYASQLEDEVYHILNLIDIMGWGDKFPSETKENIIRRTKSNINHINVILQS